MSNEAFHLLSRGGVYLNKSRSEATFKSKVSYMYSLHILSNQIFGKQTNATKNSPMAAAGGLPPELDFFKYAQNVTGKRKGTVQTEDIQARQRRRKVEDIENEESQTEQELSNPTVHRVKTKGINIPTNIESFEELRKYSIPAHLYPNLASNGYKLPTGVQSHCIPILLEVSCCNNVVVYIVIILCRVEILLQFPRQVRERP